MFYVSRWSVINERHTIAINAFINSKIALIDRLTINILVYKIRKINAPAAIPTVKSISVVDINANLKEIIPQQVDLGTNRLISALTCTITSSFYFYLTFC